MPSIYELARQKSEALREKKPQQTGAEKIKKAKQKRGKIYRENHHEQIQEYNAKYRKTHREKIKQYTAETKEKRADWWKGYYEKNKEEILKKQRERRRKNKEEKDPVKSEVEKAQNRNRQNKYLQKIRQDPQEYQKFLKRRRELRKARCQKTLTNSSPPHTPGTQNSIREQSK